MRILFFYSVVTLLAGGLGVALLFRRGVKEVRIICSGVALIIISLAMIFSAWLLFL